MLAFPRNFINFFNEKLYSSISGGMKNKWVICSNNYAAPHYLKYVYSNYPTCGLSIKASSPLTPMDWIRDNRTNIKLARNKNAFLLMNSFIIHKSLSFYFWITKTQPWEAVAQRSDLIAHLQPQVLTASKRRLWTRTDTSWLLTHALRSLHH